MCKKNERTPLNFQKFISEELFPDIRGCVGKGISERLAARWMQRLGWKYEVWEKGLYIDGYEREDVVLYRKKFAEKFVYYSQFMEWYDEDELEDVHVPDALLNGKKVV